MSKNRKRRSRRPPRRTTPKIKIRIRMTARVMMKLKVQRTKRTKRVIRRKIVERGEQPKHLVNHLSIYPSIKFEKLNIKAHFKFHANQ